ncbi:50S ribosomal protein L33 [Mycoplasma sp. NEAQ87857]|uniref:50S ribosomal protein L33 n=1 Tax=Mycoplasma sp. NEAQ87857 TaxID=2683967 RepID=UPI001316257D|nr:50S ribosomal protein L33 [Mycoplasma sp. NEAQ87857]QGZ97932.1 50S ribosomal protein L33 [Mycoplasma sp. NEAQ87857]
MKNNNKVSIACQECKKKNYTKNKSLGSDKRIVIKKHCPHCKVHTVHKEEV